MSLKKNLDDLVYETICLGFVGGTYVAGKRLDPAELSDRYQVSKTPVVQALKRMANERIINITTGGKYIIPVVTSETIKDICSLRLMFEEHAVASVCESITEEKLNELMLLKNSCDSYFNAEEFDKYFLEDMNFHRRIMRFTGNECMSSLFNILINRYMVIRSTAGYALKHDREASLEHTQLLEALRNRDEKEARSIIVRHIGKIEERLQISNKNQQ